jgi:hypothetical protein
MSASILPNHRTGERPTLTISSSPAAVSTQAASHGYGTEFFSFAWAIPNQGRHMWLSNWRDKLEDESGTLAPGV